MYRSPCLKVPFNPQPTLGLQVTKELRARSPTAYCIDLHPTKTLMAAGLCDGHVSGLRARELWAPMRGPMHVEPLNPNR